MSQIPERITECNYHIIIRGLDQAQLRRWACQCIRRQIWHLLDDKGKEAARFVETNAQDEKSRLAWIEWAQRYVEHTEGESESYYHTEARVAAATAVAHVLERTTIAKATLYIATAVAWDFVAHEMLVGDTSSNWNAIWQQARTAQFEILEEIVNSA